mmetsp:Transcript_21192/g.40892  ORF Transcript_21192/g.40892 Transcript_21192/m.40892 type:complete len:363 (-) Transcript_21192:66-1154(-)
MTIFNNSRKTISYLVLLLLSCGARNIYAKNIQLKRITNSPTFKRNSVAQPLFTQNNVIEISRLRGGASDSKSAWSAGSRRYYPSGSGFSSNQSKTSSAYRNDDFSNASYRAAEEQATKDAFAEAFRRREDRNRFIARVYAILTGQLLFTAGTIHAFHLNPGIRNWMLSTHAGRKVPIIGLIISTIAWWITLSSEHTRQSSPMRWPILFAFTAGESIAVGFISSVYAYATVTKAMFVTAASTFSIMAYTHLQKNPKYDLSQWGRALGGLGMAFLVYGLIHVLELFGVLPSGFLPYSEAIYGFLGAGLFSLYLAHHTRLIVSGKSAKYQMNEKDYILGAMSLYSDIINIFLYILRILGEIENSD